MNEKRTGFGTGWAGKLDIKYSTFNKEIDIDGGEHAIWESRRDGLDQKDVSR
jgi:hypothetical protein